MRTAAVAAAAAIITAAAILTGIEAVEAVILDTHLTVEVAP
jgi:hypothetical protein